jgi:CO/xanthine dehydrogenase FAD-binding subunit
MKVLVPASLEEALTLAAAHPSFLLLAGGSDIVPALKKGSPQRG